MKFKSLLCALLWSCVLMAGPVQFRGQSVIPLSNTDDLQCMYFDSQGILWIGTNSGLKSYDGYQMRTYRSDAYSPGILPNNTVLCITEDLKDNLWLGTHNGMVRMNKRTGVFQTYDLPKAEQRIIYTLFTSRDGTVWAGTDEGLSRYCPEKDSFETFHVHSLKVEDTRGNPVTLASYSVKSIVEDKAGHLFIGTWASGLLRLDPKTKAMVMYPQMNEMNSAYSLCLDSKGRLWIGTWGYGIVRIDDPLDTAHWSPRRWKYEKECFNTYYNIIEDQLNGTVWACCREGISILDLQDDEAGFTHYRNLPGGLSVPLSFCYDLATDGNGNIWVGTLNDGVIHVTTRHSLFGFYALSLPDDRMPVSKVCALYTSDGRYFWVGLQPFGLMYYDSRTGKMWMNNEIPALADMPQQAFGAAFPSIIRRSNGELWIASRSLGLLVLSQSGKSKWIHYSSDATFQFDNYVNTLYETRDRRVWIGSRSGVSVVHRDDRGGKLTMTEGDEDFSHCDVRGFCEDHKGNVWIATENEGVIRVMGDKYHHYYPGNGKFPVDDVTNCYEDSHNRLWAISNSGGLFRYDGGTDRFIPVNREYQIDGQKALGIREDRQGNLWVTTEKALVCLSFGEHDRPMVASFSHEDGLGEFRFYSNAIFGKGERMFVSSRNGLVTFVPREVNASRTSSVKASLIVTDILIGDIPWQQVDSVQKREISAESPAYTRRITLPASVDKFAVEYSLLTFVNQEQNRYAYMLEGYDDNWHYQDAMHRRAIFGNLPSGSYALHLKAMDSYGNWTELPYTIRVDVLPPWYRSWWALLIWMLLTLMGGYGCFCWYRNYLKTKNRLAMASVFTNITHELLTPLTVISSSIDELRREAPGHETSYGVIQNNISRLTRLLRQMLEVSKSHAGKLRLKVSHGDLSAFVCQLCDNIAPMSAGKRERIEVDCHPVAGYFDTDKVDKILYNLMSNALKYNREGGCVRVTLREQDHYAVLQVEDEGIGIAKDRMKHLYTKFLDGDYRRMHTLGTGIGLSLTRDLVLLHHGTIACSSEVGKGTCFTVRWPLEREAYSEAEIEEDQPASVVPEAGDTDREIASSEEKEYTMLIVEDNPELLSLMQRMLGKHYHVLTAKNGQQAWNIIQKQELDVVISDVMMPVMDGIELTRKIKDSLDFSQLPVILLTAKTRDEDRNAGYKVGADEYLTKPFRMEDLELRVDNIIRNRERIRQRFRQTTISDEGALQVGEGHYSSPDELFLQRATECVKQHLLEYDREQFARDMCVSSSTLYNKLRALTGQNVMAFINSIRMKEACRIAGQQPGIRVNELAASVGISTPKYFSKCFKEEIGMLPSEYLEKLQERQ